MYTRPYTRPQSCDVAEFFIERLNYGKLAIDDDFRIPSSEGYGVTRRSRGLDPARDRALLPPRLMDVRRFDPEHLDEKAQAKGCLLARVAPDWPAGSAPPVTLMRARFRPEDGERGRGRLYQQSAVWVADFECWRREPAALLALADAELAARPDLLHETEAARLRAEPLRRPIAGQSASRRQSPFSFTGAVRILEALIDAAYAGNDLLLTFGEGDEFANESEFLAAAGLALQFLPEDFPRWRDISILSGLRLGLPGLCIRLLPSWRRTPARVAA